jgi:hypothetical protein
MLGDAKDGWVNYRRSQLRAKKSGQRDALGATASLVVLIELSQAMFAVKQDHRQCFSKCRL